MGQYNFYQLLLNRINHICVKKKKTAKERESDATNQKSGSAIFSQSLQQLPLDSSFESLPYLSFCSQTSNRVDQCIGAKSNTGCHNDTQNLHKNNISSTH